MSQAAQNYLWNLYDSGKLKLDTEEVEIRQQKG